jgi:hypothetical protein
LYWNRRPGVFVNKTTGEQAKLQGLSGGPAFTGTTREWYETLVETLIDLKLQLGKALGKSHDSVNVYVDPDVLCMLECSVLYKPFKQKGAPPKTVGQLCGMNILKDTSNIRFHITMMFNAGTSSLYGGVKVVEN